MSFKILKFNESQKRYPIEVSLEELREKERIHKPIYFTPNEIDTISNILKSKSENKLGRPLEICILKDKDLNYSRKGEIEKTLKDLSPLYSINFYCDGWSPYSSNSYTILKLEDDWFTIYRGNNSNVPYREYHRYICDEFDELVNYLTDILE